MLTRSRISLVAPVLVTVLAPAASAQARVELGPFLAFYTPLSSFELAPYYTTRLPHSPGDLSGAAWGGEARLWLTQRAGLQLQIAAASSTVGGGNTPGGPASSTPARVLTASAQALYTVPPCAHTARIWIGGGLGVVRHGGAAYAPYRAPTQLATVLGLGSAIPIGRHLNATVGVTTFLYSIDVSDSAGTALEHGAQVDPLVHAGLAWSWR
jgi:hypothetical protein